MAGKSQATDLKVAAQAAGRDRLYAWLAGASLSTLRDVQEESGVQRGWMRRYAADARALPKTSQWRRQKVEMAVECRARVTYLAALTLATGGHR